jgi:hypothetical protein
MRNFASISRSRFALVALLAAFVCVATVGCGAVVERAKDRAAVEKVQSQWVVYVDRFADKAEAMQAANPSDPLQVFRESEKIYVECRDSARLLDVSACPVDYQTAFHETLASLDAICDYLGKITSGEIELDPSLEPEFRRLSNVFTSLVSRQDEVAAKYCGQ